MKTLKIFAMFLAGFFDLSAGAFIVYITGKFLAYNFSPFHYIIGGVAGALPDFDLIFPIIFHKGQTERHRHYLSHKPIVAIPVAFLIGSFLGGWMWALITLVCVSCHFIHDSILSEGITWLWPFSENFYVLRSSTPIPLDEFLCGWLNPKFPQILEFVIAVSLVTIVMSEVVGYKFALTGGIALLIFTVAVWTLISRMCKRIPNRL